MSDWQFWTGFWTVVGLTKMSDLFPHYIVAFMLGIVVTEGLMLYLVTRRRPEKTASTGSDT